jgi:hypothetical protein
MRGLDEPVLPAADVIDGLLADRGLVEVLDVDGRAELVVDQPLAVRAEVAGYRPLHAVLRPADGPSGWTLMLDPVRERVVSEPRAADRLVIAGWVHDHESFQPIAGAEVRVSHDDVSARSDAEGYFELEVAPPAIVDQRPEPFAVRVTHPDYPEWRRPGVLSGSGSMSMPVALGAPSPGPTHRLQADPAVGPEPTVLDMERAAVRESVGDSPPATIAVGFADPACSVTCGRPGCLNECSHTCVFSLETYVRRGLPQEWIGSWNHHALTAGAVAYRSFGAWHVANPLPEGGWDICSNACCQVNDPETQSGTDHAVARTVGLMLVRDGQVFRSEYAAQNNNLLGARSCTNVDCDALTGLCVCGDGAAGSPSTDWPCLDDPPSAGDSCFGHGRGMSQWGNQFWTLEAEPKNWKQQLDHYYNASGEGTGLRTSTISQVMVIDAVRVSPSSVEPGEAFTIELDVRNLAGEPHEAVLVGASLRQPGEPFIDDSDNDQPVVLPSGESTQSRQFHMPEDADSGHYQLWVALWIDVDEDELISSEDLWVLKPTRCS